MAKFGMRNDYTIVSVYGYLATTADGEILSGVTGYAAKCTCILGDHYLAQYPNGFVSECTSDRGAVPDECIFQTYADAQAAIEAWQRQHQHESEE